MTSDTINQEHWIQNICSYAECFIAIFITCISKISVSYCRLECVFSENSLVPLPGDESKKYKVGKISFKFTQFCTSLCQDYVLL